MQLLRVFEVNADGFFGGEIHDPQLSPGAARAVEAHDGVGDEFAVRRNFGLTDGAELLVVGRLQTVRLRAGGGRRADGECHRQY